MPKMESSKRKPLSDITNTYNLIPTSDLRKLVAASSTSNSFSEPPLSILKSNSSSTNQKFCSESSNRSNTSVGSSNFSTTLNSKSTQFHSPRPAISSITSPGVIGSKGGAHNRRQITEKSRKEKEADVIFSCTPVEKREDKGKVIAVRYSSLPAEKIKDNRNDICIPSTPVERQNQKGLANLSLSCGSDEMVKESEKGILNSYSCLFGKAEKGKAILNTSARALGKPILNTSARALGKQPEKGKGIADNSSCSIEKTDDGKEGILKRSRSSIVKIKAIGQEFLNPSSFVVERAKDKGKPLNTFNSSHEKTRGKGKSILQPSDIVEIAEHKGSSAAVAVKSGFRVEREKDKGKPLNTFNSSHEKTREKGKEKGKAILQPSDIVEILEPKGSSAVVAVKSRPPRRKSEKRKIDAGASSCPPMMRPKSIKIDLDEAEDIKSSKSWTDPHPKCRKKSCTRIETTSELPQDFIEQQKAYFKEIDEFELPEEEVTPDELE